MEAWSWTQGNLAAQGCPRWVRISCKISFVNSMEIIIRLLKAQQNWSWQGFVELLRSFFTAHLEFFHSKVWIFQLTLSKNGHNLNHGFSRSPWIFHTAVNKPGRILGIFLKINPCPWDHSQRNAYNALFSVVFQAHRTRTFETETVWNRWENTSRFPGNETYVAQIHWKRRTLWPNNISAFSALSADFSPLSEV